MQPLFPLFGHQKRKEQTLFLARLFCGLLILVSLVAWNVACGTRQRSNVCYSHTDCQSNEICYIRTGQCVRTLQGTNNDGGNSSQTDQHSPQPDTATAPPTCTTGHQCTQNQNKCTPSGWRSQCLLNPKTGCRVWSPSMPCPEGKVCSNNQCSDNNPPTCSNKCKLGAKRCNASGLLENCQSQSNGCLIWGAPQSCPSQHTCQAGECKAATNNCTNDCAQNGAQQCKGNQIQTCTLQQNCKKWKTTQTCGTGESCQANNSLASCKVAKTYETELQFCVDEINRYRKQAGRSSLTRDSALEAFAAKATENDAKTGKAHGYFSKTRGGGVSRAENEIPGWPQSRYGSIKKIIEEGTRMMYNEGPGGGHHDNIVNAGSTKVGCGIFVTSSGKVWVTHEFR